MEANCSIPEGNYIIDFAVIFDGTDVKEVIIIELNNYARTTGSSLFHWDADIDILAGKKEFEFRLVLENQYDNVDYDKLVGKEIIMAKNQVKAKVVNDTKTFSEKHFKWIKKVVPNDVRDVIKNI